MDKNRIERIFRSAGLTPEKRQRLKDRDVFIADGLSVPPHNAWRRFGIGADQFRFGMFITFWWLGKDEKLEDGQPLFFDAFHDTGLSQSSKKQARINAAMKAAAQHIERKKKNARPH